MIFIFYNIFFWNNNINDLIIQVGVRGNDVVVLGVEKKSIAKLQEERTVRKICLLDEHVVMAFAGLFINIIKIYYINN